MGNEFRSKLLAKEFRNTTIIKEIFKNLENKFSYSIDSNLKNRLKFRIYSLLDEIHIDQLVKLKLQNINWDEMKENSKSFLWENCNYWKETAELVKSYNLIT